MVLGFYPAPMVLTVLGLMDGMTDWFTWLVVTTFTSLGLMVFTWYLLASLNLVSRFRSAIHCSSSADSGLTFFSICRVGETLVGSYRSLDPHPFPRMAVISLHWSLRVLS